MSDNNNNAKTMYEAVPAAAELNKVPGFDPLKFLRRAGDSMKLDLPYQKLWFRMAHPNGRMRLTAMRITEQMAIFEAKVFLDRSDAEPFSVSVAQQTMQDSRPIADCRKPDQCVAEGLLFAVQRLMPRYNCVRCTIGSDALADVSPHRVR